MVTILLLGNMLNTIIRICGREQKSILCSMYHRQQNKYYPQKCLLVQFEASFDYSRSEFTLRVSVNCSFSNNLTPLRVIFILLAMVPYTQKNLRESKKIIMRIYWQRIKFQVSYPV